MSGSSGSSFTPTADVACEALRVKTVLNSPNPAILGQLQKGHCLEVAIERQGARDVVVARWQGQTAGSITAASFIKIIECLKAGEPFRATVLAVAGGRCDLEITYGACR
ncbi:hypothetical protein ACNRDG_25335 [Ralstonia pseudosolanacearum]|uniref:hypothetical protein n=1 Tax=Ralstonia pseudosolanacearum TaxID=1310165 RepID=UPI003AAC171F